MCTSSKFKAVLDRYVMGISSKCKALLDRYVYGYK